MNPAAAARTILLDANTLAITIDTALQQLDAALAGWPTSTPGAAPATGGPLSEGTCDEIPCGRPLPCSDHPTTSSSIVERTAGTDKARDDLDRLRRDIRRAQPLLANAARLALKWGTHRLNDGTIAKRLAAIDTDLWCRTCSAYGLRNSREEGRTECGRCADIRRDYGVTCPKDIHDLTVVRTRIYDADIVRILTRLGLKWKRPKKQAGAA